MPEEFLMHVTFEFDTLNQMKHLKDVFEHLDLYEHDDAQKILSSHALKNAMTNFEQCITKHCHFNKTCNLVEMYTSTFDESVDDMALIEHKSGFQGEITVEGMDREATDFCSSLVLILLAMNGKSINAQARSDYWRCQWTFNNKGKLEFSMSTLDES